MKRILAALVVALALPAAAADVVVGANLVSWHSEPGLEAFTPGLYVRTPGAWFLEAGAYRNSQGFPSAHVGGGYSHAIGRWDISVMVGAVYGYRDEYDWIYPDGSPAFTTYDAPRVRPMVVPSVGYRAADGWSPRVFAIPPKPGDAQSSWCVSFAIGRRFE